MKKINWLTALVFCVITLAGQADTDTGAENTIINALKTMLPGETVTRIRTTPFEGLYEVVLGPNVIYMSGDGRFILKGDLLDMQIRQNLSENQRELARKQIFDDMEANEYIEFSPEKPKHLIYVFTDTDCAYCRRLHQDVPELNKGGLGVRYLAYPRAGIGSHAYNQMEAVWCAGDRKQALTDAKNGKNIDAKQCPNPVKNEYELGQKFGVKGTPAIYTESGRELSGYIPPAELLKIMDK